MSVQELSVEVQGEDIVVILPGTSFKVVYHKPLGARDLQITTMS
jgi:hypothetical protein